MTEIETFSIICSFAIAFIVTWYLLKKPKLQTASGDTLSRWGVMYATPRIFYGEGSTKPDEDCFWDKNGEPVGWYETDASLKKRITIKLMRL